MLKILFKSSQFLWLILLSIFVIGCAPTAKLINLNMNDDEVIICGRIRTVEQGIEKTHYCKSLFILDSKEHYHLVETNDLGYFICKVPPGKVKFQHLIQNSDVYVSSDFFFYPSSSLTTLGGAKKDEPIDIFQHTIPNESKVYYIGEIILDHIFERIDVYVENNKVDSEKYLNENSIGDFEIETLLVDARKTYDIDLFPRQMKFVLDNKKEINGEFIAYKKKKFYIKAGSTMYIVSRKRIDNIFKKEIDITDDIINNPQNNEVIYNNFSDFEEIK